ncbi:MAG: hypothetical protein QOI06_3459 [Nocardioidaceae bacterium]|nr:hypothetical protein [Nocardioidaceae bacterium]
MTQTPATQSPVTRPSRGYGRSLGGMVGALISVMGLIAFVWALSWFQHRTPANPAVTVRYGPVLATARSQAPFHVVAPEPVPPGLRATSVSWDGVGPTVLWQLGFVTSQQAFVGLYQGNGPAAQLIAANTPATQPSAPVTIGGIQWLTLTNPSRGETALVHTQRGMTVLVTGTAGEAQLVSFVRSLH